MKQGLFWVVVIWLLGSVYCQSGYASVAQISQAHLSHTVDHHTVNTRFILTLNQPIAYHYFTLTSPDRVVLDIQHAKLVYDLKKLSLRHTPIKAVRFQQKRQGLRFVLDLKQPVQVKATLLARMAHQTDRLVLSLISNQSKLGHANQQKTKVKTGIRDLAKKTAMRDITIVIDPGHGGKDPGAIGVRGVREKKVVLDISENLYHMMQKEPGLKPVLTRSDDHFISLRDRLQRARAYRADLFIAIHADAYKDRSAHGASVFALSRRGASSEAARWLAQKENYSELGGVDLNGLETKDITLRSVLIDLSQTATIAQSLNVGACVLSQLGHINTLHHSHVEQARFVVLKSPDIPSILIETGFLSDPSEERKLSNPAYRREVAKAILMGIKQYFRQYPPAHTRYALAKAQQQSALSHRHMPIKYTVEKGDTLSFIAEQYHVSILAIARENHLHSHRIRVGQVLILPVSKIMD